MTAAARPEVRRASRVRGRPLLAAILAIAGSAIAAYLALFQLGVVAYVWDPLFGNGSVDVLTSAPARALPVPDAALGMAGYLVELGLIVAAAADRRGDHPGIRIALGAVAGLMALGGVGLVALQAFVIGAFCTLCLASAGVSIALAILVVPEAAEALSHVSAAPGRRGRLDPHHRS